MTLALATRERAGGELVASSTLEAVQHAIGQLKALRTFVSEEMKEGIDFGVIPGTGTKPTLYLAGAQKTALYFNVSAEITHDRIELGDGHLEVVSTCRLLSRNGSVMLAMGSGSCSTMESKYRFRKGERTCPVCGQAAIIAGRKEYGGGWVCFNKKGGCGEKYDVNDPAITGQQVGRVENPDIYDSRNTVLKMANKRAQVAAALNLGAMAELFTQDIEDIYDLTPGPAPETEPEPAVRPKAKTAPKPETRAKPDPGRDAVNAEFRPRQATPPKEAPAKAPTRPAKGKAETWDMWVKPTAERAEAAWKAELDRAGVAKAKRVELCSVYSLTNHVVSRAVEAGLVKAEWVGKDGDPAKRDQGKAFAEANRLFAEMPANVKQEVEQHVAEKRLELLVRLGLAKPEAGDDDPDAGPDADDVDIPF